jgi:hypothetical protein
LLWNNYIRLLIKRGGQQLIIDVKVKDSSDALLALSWFLLLTTAHDWL